MLEIRLIFVQNDVERNFMILRYESVPASGIADQSPFVFKHELMAACERAW